jgi:hypothetical protein
MGKKVVVEKMRNKLIPSTVMVYHKICSTTIRNYNEDFNVAGMTHLLRFAPFEHTTNYLIPVILDSWNTYKCIAINSNTLIYLIRRLALKAWVYGMTARKIG